MRPPVVDRLTGRARRKADRPDTAQTSEADPTAAVWARVQLARNLRRPRTLELLALIADDFVELHGDRFFGDDPAIVAGLARIDGRRVVVVGQQKGAETDENIRRNFGMPHPEGYRKAIRVMELAERLGLPIVTFVDVPGAHPGAESEERGIAEAIARSIAVMSRLRTPIVTVITGEGGSGGALAIAVGDVVLALENAVYSVISPEGCASILWRTPDQAPAAALAMRMTAADQLELGVVDEVDPRAARRRPERPSRHGGLGQGGGRPSPRRPRAGAARRADRRALSALSWPGRLHDARRRAGADPGAARPGRSPAQSARRRGPPDEPDDDRHATFTRRAARS